MKRYKKSTIWPRAVRRQTIGNLWPLLLLAALLLLVLTACGGGASTETGSDPAGSVAEPALTDAHDTLSVVSLNRFKKAAASYGEPQDMTEDYGFDACAVAGADGTNFIYMYLPDAEMTRQLVTDADGDGAVDDSIAILKQGGNYEYYREQIDDPAGQSVFGYYLRVDSMLLLVVGNSAQEASVQSRAEEFFDALGYQLPAV